MKTNKAQQKTRSHPRSHRPRPLAPRKPRALVRQAKRRMHAIYRPTLVSLNKEQRRVKALADKRAADNRDYQQWLDTKNKEWDVNATAAERATEQAARNLQDTTTKNYQSLRKDLIDSGQSDSVSNLHDANAFDMQSAGGQALAQIANAETAARLANANADSLRQGMISNDRAQLANIAAQQQSDTWEALQKIADKRVETRADRASDTAKEAARLLDQEIDKAKARADIANSQREIRLRRGALRLQRQQMHVDDANTDADRAERSRESRREAKTSRGNNRRDNRGGDSTERREELKITRNMNASIRNGLYVLHNDKHAMNALKHGDRRSAKHRLVANNVPAYLFPAIFDVYQDGKLKPKTLRELKGMGALPDQLSW